METFSSILLMLTPSEASELASKLKSIDANEGEHIHINDLEYKREITIAIYTDENLHFYNEEIRNLIKSP